MPIVKNDDGNASDSNSQNCWIVFLIDPKGYGNISYETEKGTVEKLKVSNLSVPSINE